MKKHCRVIAGNCRACLQFNITRRGFHPLRTIGATYPFDHISIDLGQISVTSQLGNNYFLVVIDICTRYILIRPIPSKSALVARSLVKIYSDFGIPKILQSDNGTEFVNQIMDELKNNCGFEQRTISSYYPQSNGAAENAVKQVKTLLKKMSNGDYTHWCLRMPAIQMALNAELRNDTIRHRSH